MILRRGNIPWLILFALMFGFVVWLLSNMSGQIIGAPVIWVFVGVVLFGAVAFIALRKSAESMRDFCPECGEDVEKGAVTCPNCGHDMGAERDREKDADGARRDRDTAPVG
jgi:hypothetical protein